MQCCPNQSILNGLSFCCLYAYVYREHVKVGAVRRVEMDSGSDVLADAPASE